LGSFITAGNRTKTTAAQNPSNYHGPANPSPPGPSSKARPASRRRSSPRTATASSPTPSRPPPPSASERRACDTAAPCPDACSLRSSARATRIHRGPPMPRGNR
jgi:hypothetical protein